MNSEILFDCITALPDGMVEAAEGHVFRRKKAWKPWAAAAAVTVIVGLGLMLHSGALRGMGQSAPGVTGSGGGGTDGVSYMHYVGPVLPLTAPDGAEGITAERSVDYDFSPYRTELRTFESGGKQLSYDASKREALVTDRYVLTNESDDARTLTLLYGAPLRFNDALACLPEITVDGAPAETALHAGPYSGCFANARGERDETERLNLEEIRSWSGYAELLADGTYQAAAFEAPPALDFPVIVYRVDGYEVAPTDAVNPTLQLSFSLDPEKTTVLTYGSNGGSNDYESGVFSRIVGAVNDPRTSPMMLIVIGDDIAAYSLQGYRNGGANPGEEIDVGASVTRYETTMDTVLRMVVDEHFDTDGTSRSRSYLYGPFGEATVAAAATREMLYDAAADLLLRYGVLSDNPAGRFAFGMLEEVFEAYSMQRILYQSFSVTIPAHRSVTVTATMRKEASYDFVGKGQKSDGYDLATQLGSTLRFTAQTASVSNADAVEILDNSFGFDPENGVTEVRLDPAAGHYWMQVKKR